VKLEVLAAAGGLVAINKPPGLLVIPGRNEDDQVCARDLLARQLGREVWICHRIDRDTSGVLLLATDAEAHRRASMAFEHGEVNKRYLALVQGHVRGPLDIDLALAPARKGKMRVAVPGEAGKASRTLVVVREAFARATLVECEPLTGRQHQIRVHLRAKGHPLLFDHQYGRREPLLEKDLGGAGEGVLLERTPLHAALLEVPTLSFKVECPLPADMARTLEVLRSAA
jgi:tRNA pseudouridine32 synthase/23S rRNA pseudouridine746 synthase/23S rRNA pseudouridine955/2504/2580 synthase